MSQDVQHDQDTYNRWLKLKQEEFTSQGYNNVEKSDIWSYFERYKWKKEVPQYYHEVVQDIVDLTSNDYFNYARIKAQVYDVKDIEEYDLTELI